MTHSVHNLADLRGAQWAAEERARREARRQSPIPAIPPGRTVITISRQYGAGARSVAALVAADLGPDWEVWGHEIVDAIAHKAHVNPDLVEEFDEHMMPTSEQVLRYVTNYWRITPEKYHSCLVDVLKDLGKAGKKIVVGHGASFVLRDSLKVRICASDPFRVKQAMEYEPIDAAHAGRRINEMDAERERFVRRMYNKDICGSESYAMILHVDQLGVATTAAAIAAAMRSIICELSKVHE